MKTDIKQKIKKGYVVVSDSKDYVTMKKPKKFNGWIFGLCILCGFIPGVIYLIYYASKSEKTVTEAKK